MTTKHSSLRIILLCLLATALTLNVAKAQDVRYRTTSKTKLEILSFLGGLSDVESKQEVSIKGNKMRSDDKNTSSIIDLDGERMINIDHKKKEYTIMTFAQLAEMMQSLEQRMQGQTAPSSDASDAPQYDVSFDLDLRDTGNSQKIDGYTANEKILILETRFTPKDASADTLPSGSFYAVTDMWMADDIPEMEPALSFQKRMAEVMQSNLRQTDLAGAMNQMLKSYPQVGAALEKSKEEMANMEGFPLISKMYMITVPADAELDLELALGEKKEEKKGGGFGGLMKNLAKAKGIGSGDEDDSSPTQKTLMSVTSTTDSISDKSRDASYFEPPAGYKEIEYESPFKDTENK